MTVTCSVCSKPLPTSLDEYGDIRKPVCFGCFISDQAANDTHRKHIAEKIDDLDSEIQTIEAEIDDLQNTLYELRRERRVAEAEMTNAGTQTKQDENRRLQAWIKGLAKIAKDTTNDNTRAPLLQLN